MCNKLWVKCFGCHRCYGWRICHGNKLIHPMENTIMTLTLAKKSNRIRWTDKVQQFHLLFTIRIPLISTSVARSCHVCLFKHIFVVFQIPDKHFIKSVTGANYNTHTNLSKATYNQHAHTAHFFRSFDLMGVELTKSLTMYIYNS